MRPAGGLAERRVKQLGREAGFDLVRIAPAIEMPLERERYLAWIEAGRAADMRWMTAERAARSADPRSIVSDARSVICVGLSYWRGKRPADRPGQGRIARYAWGSDYHQVMIERLHGLAETLERELGGKHRAYVDTGPLMDKALAARSGLGWYGKNTNILTEPFGSYVLLGEIVTTLDLQVDAPTERDCGSCRLCMVACPTGALGPEYTIDSRKCISYLTIEHRGPIPPELRSAMGSWVFGCDICQDVCPPTVQPHLRTADDRRAWAREVRTYMEQVSSTASRQPPRRGDLRPPAAPGRGVLTPAAPGRSVLTPAAPGRGVLHTPASPEEPSSRPLQPSVGRESPGGTTPPNEEAAEEPAVVPHPLFADRFQATVDLVWLLGMTHEEYLEAFRGTAIRRAKDWMLRRNAAVALGNTGDEGALEPLERALREDPHAVVRGHAAWALGRLRERFDLPAIAPALQSALEREEDPEVRRELEMALG